MNLLTIRASSTQWLCLLSSLILLDTPLPAHGVAPTLRLAVSHYEAATKVSQLCNPLKPRFAISTDFVRATCNLGMHPVAPSSKLLEWLFGGGRSPDPPSDNREGGGSRDQCPATDLPLTAIVPSDDRELSRRYTKTASEHPPLWFYVPFSPELKFPVEFVLIDENENDIYVREFTFTGTPGFVKVQFPDHAPGMEPDKLYRWVLSVICNPENRSGDIAVDGWIQREEVEGLEAKLQSAGNWQQRVQVYQDERLWHETLNSLAELQREDPGNEQIREVWRGILEQVDLEHLANENLTSCCTL